MPGRLSATGLAKGIDSAENAAQGPANAMARGRLDFAFIRAGGHLVVGSDSGGAYRILGFANVKSVERLHERFGFSELEAIGIATINGAAALGIQDRTGTVAAGKEAALLIVRGDPSTRIRDLENVQIVFSNGVRYDPNALLKEVQAKFGWQ
jgi:imidazolonepropionase-like amidohydrolase